VDGSSGVFKHLFTDGRTIFDTPHAPLNYQKCTSRGLVWYKKLVPGTKVLFDDFLGRAVMGSRKLERFSFWFPFPVPAKRNLSRRSAFFELKRDGGGWEEARYVFRGAGVTGARRV
jgi:hypothetical protein